MARKQRNRAQKVVLASAIFDPDGKVLLTMDGMFPCREITDSFHERVSPNIICRLIVVLRREFRYCSPSVPMDLPCLIQLGLDPRASFRHEKPFESKHERKFSRLLTVISRDVLCYRASISRFNESATRKIGNRIRPNP